MEIIVPAAGKSTRFPNMPPKYLLKDNNGNLMIENALKPYFGKGDINVGVLLAHVHDYDAFNAVSSISTVPSIHVRLILRDTKGPAETVYLLLRQIMREKDDGAFLIKDCDSFFDHSIRKGNYICTTKIGNYEKLRNLMGKSFVQTNDQGFVTDIVEKKVVSDTFCVGGYKFEKMSEYIEAYEAIQDRTDEIYVSHVIQYMLSQGKQFAANDVWDYVDVGTIDEWNEYLK